MSGADLGPRLDDHHEPVPFGGANTCVSCKTHTEDGKHAPHEHEREQGESFLRIFDPIHRPPGAA